MKAKHWVVFILLGLIWSSSFMWIKIAIAQMGPSTLVAYRVLFGLLFGIGVILYSRQKLPATLGAWVPLFVLGMLSIAIPFFFVSYGELFVESGVAAILNSTTPLFAIVGAHFLLPDDKMSWTKVIGLALGFFGVIVLMSESLGGNSNSLIGQICMVAAAMSYASGAIFARKFTQDMPNILRSLCPLVSANLVMWAFALSTEAPVSLPSTAGAWIALVWLGVFGSGVAFLMMNYLIHEVGPTRASMVTYVFPLGGVSLGVIFLGEPLTFLNVLGAVLISVSLVVAGRH